MFYYIAFILFQDDIEIDLDEVLDMEDEKDRRLYISVCIRNVFIIKSWIRITIPITQFLYISKDDILTKLLFGFAGAASNRWE